MSRCIKLLKYDAPNIERLVAFSDPVVGHYGGIYRACNWIYTGQNKCDYRHLLSSGEIVHKSRFRCKNGKREKELVIEAGAIKQKIPVKHRYVYKLKNMGAQPRAPI